MDKQQRELIRIRFAEIQDAMAERTGPISEAELDEQLAKADAEYKKARE